MRLYVISYCCTRSINLLGSAKLLPFVAKLLLSISKTIAVADRRRILLNGKIDAEIFYQIYLSTWCNFSYKIFIEKSYIKFQGMLSRIILLEACSLVCNL